MPLIKRVFVKKKVNRSAWTLALVDAPLFKTIREMRIQNEEVKWTQKLFVWCSVFTVLIVLVTPRGSVVIIVITIRCPSCLGHIEGPTGKEEDRRAVGRGLCAAVAVTGSTQRQGTREIYLYSILSASKLVNRWVTTIKAYHVLKQIIAEHLYSLFPLRLSFNLLLDAAL